jgi:hypothetical protein
VKERAVAFAAVEAVADADAVGLTCHFETNIAAQATASQSIHVTPPLQNLKLPIIQTTALNLTLSQR